VRRECKVARLQRLLARVREPAVVFTEYRDTLRHVAAALELECAMVHGGMAADERAREIRRFTHGTVPVLLATDAASEGLNLHRRCRLVVNLDLPWTPLRLEQRVGRVDRIGQPRAVHAITLAARGTLDAQVAATLATRAARAARDAPFAAEDASGLAHEAVAEADRLAGVRRLVAGAPTPAPVDGRPVVTVLRRGCARRLLVALRLFFVDSTGAAVWETLAGIAIDSDEALDPLGAGRPRAWLEAVQQAGAIPLAAAAAALHDAALASVRADACAEADAQLARERAILQRLARDQARLAAPVLQAGLFDRRALRERDAQRRLAGEAMARSRRRIVEIERQRTPAAGIRSLVFAAAWLR
jgi:hypothetical protein